MYPVLLSLGSLHIYSFSVFLILSWLVFSFFFWRSLREQAVPEDRIFDVMFYSTIVAAVVSRLWFVFSHPELFRENYLLVAALWVQPGLSLYGAIIGGLVTFVVSSRVAKVRLAHLLDAASLSFPIAFLVGQIGSLLGGIDVGKETSLPWAISYVGGVGRRHPIQIYTIVVLAVLIVVLLFISGRSVKQKWPYGLVGLWFFLLFSPAMFALEFVKESSVYFYRLSANQWVLIALFAESLGAFYVRGGGRDRLIPFVRKVIGGIYAKIPRRTAR